MTAKMIEGLTGSYANMNLRETPLQNYQRAAQRRDADGMRRSLDYASQMNQRIVSYQDKTTEGMREAVEEAKKQQQILQSKALERAAARQEALESARENKAGLLQNMRYDRVEISSEGRNWLQQRSIENSGAKQSGTASLADRQSSYGLSSLQNTQRANASGAASSTAKTQANASSRTQAQAGLASGTLYRPSTSLSAQQSTRQAAQPAQSQNQRATGSLGSMSYGQRMATALGGLYQA